MALGNIVQEVDLPRCPNCQMFVKAVTRGHGNVSKKRKQRFLHQGLQLLHTEEILSTAMKKNIEK
jgi:hypothetical protein